MNILFLCVANSARSQIAEALARRLAPPNVWVMSAGSAPTEVRPETAAVLAEVDIDITGQTAKSVDRIESNWPDLIITLCADEVCPAALSNARRIDWPIEDPAVSSDLPLEQRLLRFRDARTQIGERLKALFEDLVSA
jgi:arsenate reductase